MISSGMFPHHFHALCIYPKKDRSRAPVHHEAQLASLQIIVVPSPVRYIKHSPLSAAHTRRAVDHAVRDAVPRVSV